MLIIEGPDCVGKTTLAQALAQSILAISERTVAHTHLGPEGKTWPMAEYIKNMRPWTVQDRYNLSEWVYGRQYRGRSNISWEEIRNINRAISGYGGIIIFVTAPCGVYGRLLDLHHSRGELYDQIGLVETNDRFRQVARQVSLEHDIASFHIEPIMAQGTGEIRYPSSQIIVSKIAQIYVRKQLNLHKHSA